MMTVPIRAACQTLKLLLEMWRDRWVAAGRGCHVREVYSWRCLSAEPRPAHLEPARGRRGPASIRATLAAVARAPSSRNRLRIGTDADAKEGDQGLPVALHEPLGGNSDDTCQGHVTGCTRTS